MINQQTKIMKNQILTASEIISYSDSKVMYGGITPWEARFLMGETKDKQIKRLIKRRADTIAMSVDYISLIETKN